MHGLAVPQSAVHLVPPPSSPTHSSPSVSLLSGRRRHQPTGVRACAGEARAGVAAGVCKSHQPFLILLRLARLTFVVVLLVLLPVAVVLILFPLALPVGPLLLIVIL